MMEMLLDYAAGRSEVLPECLRWAFLGGDWIPVTLPERLRAIVKECRVVSVGGPTETTLWNIWYPVETVDSSWNSIPYGSPIANTRYYILNERLEDCPVWVAGEMCCAGVGLTKGYWRNEEKTRASFLTHPVTGDRLYRTGDLGRFLPDGNIEFLGREDFRLKIRGFRIEAGEIEAALNEHPAVKASIVTAFGENHSQKRLVAYVVPQQNNAAARNG
jgi:non-ribosomal peptide synthetase component F